MQTIWKYYTVLKATTPFFVSISASNELAFVLKRFLHLTKPRKDWRENSVLLRYCKMPQKQITSFFCKRIPVQISNEDKSEPQCKEDIDESPVKVKRRKKRQFISDSEDEQSPEEQSPEKSSEEDKIKTISKSTSSAENEKDTVKKNKSKSAKKRKNVSLPKKKIAKKPKQETLKMEKVDPKINEENEINGHNMTKNDDSFPPSASKTIKNVEINSKKSLVNEMSYNPAASKYHPIDNAPWKKNEMVPYLVLAKTLEAIESTSARLKIIEILSNFFRSIIVLTPEDLLPSVYLCLNELAPAYEGIELGIGDMILKKAIAQTTGRTMEKLKAEVDAKGDLGLVAEACRSNQKTMFELPHLTIRGVFAKLKEIARMTGNASTVKKMEQIQRMLVACRSSEARYLVRLLSGKLRIGLAEQSVLAALSQAALLTPPGQDYPPEVIDSSKKFSNDVFKKKLEEHTLIIKTTFSECPSYDKIIDVLLKFGVHSLPEHCHITPGIPLKPMLAHPTKGIQEVLQKLENAKFTCEFKYDGERAQIHVLENGEIHIYSRNQENNTSKYPDIISRIPRTLKEGTKSCIIDTEAVAWDMEKHQILPFQVLSTRKKKDASENDIKVKVCVYAFDLLYLNGESLVKKSFEERRELLHSSFLEIDNEFQFVRFVNSSNTEEIAGFLEEAVKGNCEGLMVKTLDVDASYEIAKRSHNWLKLKKDYLDGVGDTLDLVVIGGYHGKGKRTGTYGGFLLACYDEENEEFQSICRIGTGFTDDEFEQHSKTLKTIVIPHPKSYYRYDPSLTPDDWFEAEQVWEVKCADLSISPIHKAGIGILEDDKGISLRFPRFLNIREDKSPENATSSVEVVRLYKNQDQVKNQSKTQVSTNEVEEEY